MLIFWIRITLAQSFATPKTGTFRTFKTVFFLKHSKNIQSYTLVKFENKFWLDTIKALINLLQEKCIKIFQNEIQYLMG
ncbi:TPA: hypothetical protein I7730_00705 [Vibrio vulnificus]|uniref:Uncharacterized protein n=1 Tax=Vibrio vulnificus TaxID=672 RepID=A0A8H9MYN7_VIBVL|nr:hypothetical protein [Vibrio vulnificus]